MSYQDKYLKYKSKYLKLNALIHGGANPVDLDESSLVPGQYYIDKTYDQNKWCNHMKYIGKIKQQYVGDDDVTGRPIFTDIPINTKIDGKTYDVYCFFSYMECRLNSLNLINPTMYITYISQENLKKYKKSDTKNNFHQVNLKIHEDIDKFIKDRQSTQSNQVVIDLYKKNMKELTIFVPGKFYKNGANLEFKYIGKLKEDYEGNSEKNRIHCICLYSKDPVTKITIMRCYVLSDNQMIAANITPCDIPPNEAEFNEDINNFMKNTNTNSHVRELYDKLIGSSAHKTQGEVDFGVAF